MSTGSRSALSSKISSKMDRAGWEAASEGMRALDGTALVLESVSVKGDVAGGRLNARLTQCFKNPSDRAVEVVYSFPLPWAAVLLGVEVQLGNRELTGVVVERHQAETAYEDALAEGDAAILIERTDDGSYTLNLGNLAPGETCRITLRYAQTLAFDPTGLRLTLPTVIAPRYGDPINAGGLRPHQVVEHDPTIAYPFALELTLAACFNHARIASPSHPVAIQRVEAGRVLVSLAREGALDRDFVLTLSALAQASLALVAPDPLQPGYNAVLASFCPTLKSDDAPSDRPVRAKILVDCSGSMSGDSIQAARRALDAIVSGLTDPDRFALSRFGSRVQHRSRSLWRATEATRLAAKRWVGELEADMGGTDMEGALAAVFAQGDSDASTPADVLLITDGHIHAIDQTLRTARASGHRLFVVAIGSSPSGHFLRRLAEETGGMCDYVTAGEAVAPAVVRMFARLRSPRLSAITLRWPQGVAPTWVSPMQAALFDGDTLTIHARVHGSEGGVLELIGQRNVDTPPEVIGRATLEAAPDDDALPRMVAAAHIEALVGLQGSHGSQASDREADIRQLALDYQLISDETHFLLIHRRADGDKATDMPDLIKVKSMIPAGYGGMGSVNATLYAAETPTVLRSPQRSTYDTFGAGSRPDFDFAVSTDWSAAHRRSLTGHDSPIEVLAWLDATPLDEWPRTLEALGTAGFPKALIDWLEFLGAPDLDRFDVVRAFLAGLAHETLWLRLGYTPTDTGSLRQYAHNHPTGTEPPAPISMMLAQIRADVWPRCLDEMCAP